MVELVETVLVTGGAGFIGSHLAEGLVEKGYRVKILDNMFAGTEENIEAIKKDVDFIKGDILDLKLMQKEFKGVDYVLHEAALRSVFRSVEVPWDFNNVNINGTLNVLQAAKDAGVKRVIFASSSSVYGDPNQFPEKESFVPNPLSPYALTKVAGEYYCKLFHHLYGLETISLRYFNVFGPRQDPHSEYAAVIPKFITCCLKREQPTIYGDGLQSRDFTYVRNNVEANIAAMKAGQEACGEVFNIASGRSINLLEILEKVNGFLGTDIKPLFKPVRLGDVKKTQADISKAEKLLDFKCNYSFEDGLQETIEFFKKQES